MPTLSNVRTTTKVISAQPFTAAAGMKPADIPDEYLRATAENDDRIVDMITRIAAASEDQSSISGEILKNVEAVSAVSCRFAAGTSHIVNTGERLSRVTENPGNLVQRLNLGDRPDENIFARRSELQ